MKKEATLIVKRLQEGGYIAYFAGGAVRDILMRKEPNDIDIATSAKPEEVEKIFDKTYPTGKKFGTILVRSGGHQFEVTTFRKEGRYEDGRRPSSITFASAREDAQRRDFTINGIFYNPSTNSFIDYVGGRDDIKKRVIEFIGNPTERINEDRLRLIRAIRFKITLGFQYSKRTFEIIRKQASRIREVSPERIRDELNKIIQSENRHIGLIELSESKLLQYVIPELEEMKGVPQPLEYHHEGDCFTHTYLALKALPRDASLNLCWAVLLHDIAKPITIGRTDGRISFNDHATKSAQMAEKILGRLKFPSSDIKQVAWLIHYHMSIGQLDEMRPSKRLSFLTNPKFNDLIELVEADSKGTYPINLELVSKIQNDKQNVLRELNLKKKIINKVDFITGEDLIKLGMKPGSKFKEILEKIADLQIEGEIRSKQEGIEYIKKNYL